MLKNINSLELSEKKHFDSFSKNYDQNYGYNSKFTQYKINKKVNHCIDSLQIKKNDRLKILEIGCGTGEYSHKLAKNKQLSIISTDISPGMITEARKKCVKDKNITFKVESAYKMKSLKSKSMDVVVGFYILHHLKTEFVLREINRVLKKHGKVYFYEPNILNPLVFLIKSVPFLKKRAGDSVDEWALNPLTIRKKFPNYKIIFIKTTEYIPANMFRNYNLMKKLDKWSGVLSKFPPTKYLGGSVVFLLEKM